MRPAEPSRSSRTAADTEEDAPPSVVTAGNIRPGSRTCTADVGGGLERELGTHHFRDASASTSSSKLLPSSEGEMPLPIARNVSIHLPLRSIVVGPEDLLRFRLHARCSQMQGPILCKMHNGLQSKVRPIVALCNAIFLLNIS